MWLSKEAEVRKKEFLDAALELFYESGYDKTSINDIINKVGVTKGAFYYHFKSKDEVLDTIALQQAEEMVEVFIGVVDENDENSLAKINRIISSMQKYRAETEEKRLKIFKVLDKNENLKLRQKVFENYMRLSKPIVSKIIEQGIKEGVFTTDYSDELAEFYIYFSITINGTLNKLIPTIGERPENIEIIMRKISFYEEMFEKILGVKEGSIKFAEPVLKSRIPGHNPK
jgi:AcrR family transcriptional regulator